jgi:hypothetical protein
MTGPPAIGDLVLGMFGGYPADDAKPFLRSLRAGGYAGEVVLLLHRNPPGTADALRELGAAALPVELPDVPEVRSYNVARYRCFGELLARRGDLRQVLVCDVRDVVFQRNPFDGANGAELELFLEHPAKSIGQCLWTSSWVRYRYGDDALPPLAPSPVVCSGAVLGTRPAVLAYLRQVDAELPSALRATNYMAGYDQGVVNHLAHSGRIPAARIHPFRGARVLHLGNAPVDSIRLDEGGRVVNPEGEVVALVHQYDRHPALLERVRQAWGG